MDLKKELKSYEHILEAIDAIKHGKMIILVDDEDRENEGDFVFAAECADSEKINFLTKSARGLICLSIDQSINNRLQLPPMIDQNKSEGQRSTAFTVSIEAKQGVTTGISAHDRAHTIKVAVDPKSTAEDIVVPGHIFPLVAKNGGVLERAGHTEGSVDLVKLAGLQPAAVICEIMNDDGTMARYDDLKIIATEFNIPLISIADLTAYRLNIEPLIRPISTTKLQTKFGEFDSFIFKSLIDNKNHFALTKGKDNFNNPEAVVDVRVHRQRPWNDVFSNSSISNSESNIEKSLRTLANCECSVFIYLNRDCNEDDKISEVANLNSTSKPPTSTNRTIKVDPRQWGIGAQILHQLKVHKINIHSRQPIETNMKLLSGFGLEIVDTKILK